MSKKKAVSPADQASSSGSGTVASSTEMDGKLWRFLWGAGNRRLHLADRALQPSQLHPCVESLPEVIARVDNPATRAQTLRWLAPKLANGLLEAWLGDALGERELAGKTAALRTDSGGAKMARWLWFAGFGKYLIGDCVIGSIADLAQIVPQKSADLAELWEHLLVGLTQAHFAAELRAVAILNEVLADSTLRDAEKPLIACLRLGLKRLPLWWGAKAPFASALSSVADLENALDQPGGRELLHGALGTRLLETWVEAIRPGDGALVAAARDLPPEIAVDHAVRSLGNHAVFLAPGVSARDWNALRTLPPEVFATCPVRERVRDALHGSVTLQGAPSSLDQISEAELSSWPESQRGVPFAWVTFHLALNLGTRSVRSVDELTAALAEPEPRRHAMVLASSGMLSFWLRRVMRRELPEALRGVVPAQSFPGLCFELGVPLLPAEGVLARPGEREAALACAAQGARRFWLLPSTFARSVTSVEERSEVYHRVLHRIERRTVRLRCEPGARGGIRQAAIPDPASVDPWSVDPDELESASRVTAVCPACNGQKKLQCGGCGGSARMACNGCGGSGRVWGQRGEKNCPTCRGKGDRKCPNCHNGIVDCVMCAISGFITAWLWLDREMRRTVVVNPWNAAAEVHGEARLKDPEDFNRGGWVNDLLNDTGAQTPPGYVADELLPQLDRVAERVIENRMQTFASRVHRIHYRTRFSGASVEVAGRPPDLAPQSNWKPLLNRRRLILATAGLASVGALALYGFYSERHEWFLQFGSGGTLLGLSLLAALSVSLLVGQLLLAPPAESKGLAKSLGGISAAMTVALAIAIALFYRAGPTALGAHNALVAGDAPRAKLEAQALIDLGTDPDAGKEVLDQLHLARLAKATSLPDRFLILHDPWYSPAHQQRAFDDLTAELRPVLARMYAAQDGAGLKGIADGIGDLVPEIGGEARWRMELLLAEASLAREDSSGATANLAEATLYKAPAQMTQPFLDRINQLVQRRTAAAHRHTHARAKVAEPESGIGLAPESDPLPTAADSPPESEPPLQLSGVPVAAQEPLH